MAKRVIIVASGETERRALPHLARHLRQRDVDVQEVHVPPRNKALTAEMAAKLIKSAWYGNPSTPPDKFVLVLDLDGADPDRSLEPFRSRLPGPAEEIASRLDADTIAGRSPSFRKFVDAVTNGSLEPVGRGDSGGGRPGAV